MDSTAKYNIGGISKRLGEYKVRVRQGDRITQLKAMLKEDHTELELIDFGRKMTKGEICLELLKLPQFAQHKEMIQATYDKKTGQPAAKASAAKPAKVAKPKVAKAVKQPKVVQSQPKVVAAKPTQTDDDDLLVEELMKLIA